jgi:hypothetical protein
MKRAILMRAWEEWLDIRDAACVSTFVCHIIQLTPSMTFYFHQDYMGWPVSKFL